MASPPLPPCRALQRWTIASFVAAFFDLALAAVLLYAAALAFAASKFLSFFALRLPCTCNYRRPCIQRELLVDYPTSKIAAIHAAVRRRFPFRHENPHCWAHSECCCYCADFDAIGSGGGGAGVAGHGRMIEFGGKVESCDSVSSDEDGHGRRLTLVGPQMDSFERMDYKGKGIHRRRRRKDSIRPGFNRSVSEENRSRHDSSRPLRLHWHRKEEGEQAVGYLLESKASFAESAISGSGHQFSGSEDHSLKEVASASGLNHVDDIKDPSSFGYKADSGTEVNEAVVVISNLKQALEEERSSHALLLVELDKERSAAATAADEAMGMIFKLQEQKAHLEMEARQYQRIVEEKSAYDEEEMEILKEIIVMREMEKHFLENNVKDNHLQVNEEGDSSHQLVASNVDDGMEMTENNVFELSSNVPLTLEEIGSPTLKNETEKEPVEPLGNSEPLVSEHVTYRGNIKDNVCHDMEHDPQSSDHQYEYNVEEKGMVTMEVNPSPVDNLCSDYRKESNLHRKSSFDYIYERAASGKDSSGDYLNNIRASSGSDINKQDTKSEKFDTETTVLDVHVIDDRLNLIRDKSKNRLRLPPRGNASVTAPVNSVTNEIGADGKKEIGRSCSDMIEYVKTTNNPIRHASWSDLRRASMPEIESERSLLNREVELLRKRLTVIQQGRERLKLFVEQKEKEKYHLQLLEDIASQIQEISKATGNRKKPSHSLSASSSMVNLKKRRCRSASEGVNESS